MRKTAARRDAIEGEIIVALVNAGATVVQLSQKGVPDLLVGWQREGEPINLLLEVKSGKAGKLTTDQVEWHERWRGQVVVVRSVDDALRALGIQVY
jgi:hypothetical protein